MRGFNTPFTAIAISGDKIAAVGFDSEILAMKQPETEVINLNGKSVIPGLIDAHVHFSWFAKSLQSVDAHTDTIEECLSRVALKAASIRDDEWIVGEGWDQDKWNGIFPTASDLDKVVSNKPVALRASSGHAIWVNSLVLKIAGISAKTPDPFGGRIERDAKGFPTGILFENAATAIRRIIPGPSISNLSEILIPAIQKCWEIGITGVHDYSDSDALSAYQLLREKNKLGIRITEYLRANQLDNAINLGLRSGFGDDWLKIGGVKLFKDGALSLKTAHMLEPYIGTNDYGIEALDNQTLYQTCSKAAANGLVLSIHAIGDRAGKDILDTYETIRKEEAMRAQVPLRHRLEHMQILQPSDYSRLASLGIIASMQPLAATTDMLVADKYLGKRSKGSYGWRTLLDTGAVLAFGSDSPVDNINPFFGIHAAVTRRRADGSPNKDGWYPEQRISVEESVNAFTYGAAYAGYMEDKLGILEAGKLADLVVTNQDIYTCDPMVIKDTKVLATMIGGEWKYNIL